LGEPEINNAGRELSSPEEEIYCYAYGSQNALINKEGNPQTLEEFIDWLYYEEPGVKVIEEKETVLGGHKAIEVVSERNGKVKDAVYILGKDTGRGLFCVFDNLEARNEFKSTFDKIIGSFKIETSLDQ